MPKLDISGIEVNFPYDPYECQINYMKSVLESIKQKKNAILESPTGTGKTLCLLCSSISWLLTAKADMQLANIQNELGDEGGDPSLSNLVGKSGVMSGDDSNKRLPYPKIIYASRTHSQLTQVIKELKMTVYNNIKTCAIGSRDQLCINPQVNQQKSYTTKLNMCKAKVTAKTCFFYNNIEHNMAEMKKMLTVDIEDLNLFGNKHKCCPYYTARQLKDGADILFMPYNYLLDKKLRKSNGIELSNCVVIFDEAHNVERVCEESASAELSVTEIASAMAEITYILDEMKNMPEDDSPYQVNTNAFSDLDNPSNLKSNDNMPANLEELKELMLILKAIETEIDEIKVQGQEGVTKPTSFLFQLLNKAGVNFAKKGYIFEIIQRLLQYFGAQTPNPRHHNGASLGKFYDFLQTVFSDNTVTNDGTGDEAKQIKKISHYYKVHIKSDSIKGRILCYWCLCPGYSMQDLLAEGARCIILTSGTLSPISTFKDDMKIPLDIVLENPHIIKESQIKVLSLSKGPDNVVLSSKYTNRDSENYLQSLGVLVFNFCKIVPHGVLVFFPSYKALETATDFWRRNNQWKHIGDAKSIFIESKGAKECNETVLKYYERIKDKKYNGAVMFAVCRGKISEGIDFADNNGRAVIVTGLPFPLYTDPRVILKRQYLDENKCSSGNLWYNQQTYRAVNQAIGRVIRHKNDYGAIILADERFSQAGSINQLPGWMRSHIKKISDHNAAVNELKSFFNIAIENFPIIPKIPNIQGNSTYLKVDQNTLNKNARKDDYVNNMFSSYNCDSSSMPCSSATSSACCASNSNNLYDALENFKGADPTGAEFYSSSYRKENASDDVNNFKMILQKRKTEESKNPNAKCKVVIKDTVTVAEAKPQKISDSKNLLERITKKLSKEDYQTFKVALNNFHTAKKSGDNEKKVKYYKALRCLFANDLEFFGEIEKFIHFTGVVKSSSQQQTEPSKSTPLKRKIDECGDFSNFPFDIAVFFFLNYLNYLSIYDELGNNLISKI